MDANSLIAAIDAEIAMLNEARALLTSDLNKSLKARPNILSNPKPVVRRSLSKEARKRIADAQRKRWAATRKAAKAVTPAVPAKNTKKASAVKKADKLKATKSVSRKAGPVKPKTAASKKTVIVKPEASSTPIASS